MIAGCLFGWQIGNKSYSSTIISAADYPSIQEAIDQNPGQPVYVPDGDHEISEPISIRKSGTTLYGFGRIIQTNATVPVLTVQDADHVTIRDIELTRSDGQRVTQAPGISVMNSDWCRLDGIHVVDNQSSSSAIRLHQCRYGRIANCTIKNYKRISVDDRTSSDHYGYAFKCIDGTGIIVTDSQATQIIQNRIVEHNLMPTPENKQRYGLGDLTEGRYPSRGGKLHTGAWDQKYAQNWHQGSAIQVTSPESSEFTQVADNYLENAAQGIDLHCDRAICSRNIIDRSMIGIKAMHGSQHLVISDNVISHVDLWGIILSPGTASHAAQPAAGDRPARNNNPDGSTLIANNVICNYGYGNEYWNWGATTADHDGSYAIRLDWGQVTSSPPLAEVLITGNIVSDNGRDASALGDKRDPQPPRYVYALLVEQLGETNPNRIQNVRVVGNLFAPGIRGVSNIPVD